MFRSGSIVALSAALMGSVAGTREGGGGRGLQLGRIFPTSTGNCEVAVTTSSPASSMTFINGNMINVQLTGGSSAHSNTAVQSPGRLTITLKSFWGLPGQGAAYGSAVINACDRTVTTSDGGWKCLGYFPEGFDWASPDYDDSQWPSAVSYGTDPQTGVTFIGGQGSVQESFCRLTVQLGGGEQGSAAPTPAPTHSTDGPTDMTVCVVGNQSLAHTDLGDVAHNLGALLGMPLGGNHVQCVLTRPPTPTTRPSDCTSVADPHLFTYHFSGLGGLTQQALEGIVHGELFPLIFDTSSTTAGEVCGVSCFTPGTPASTEPPTTDSPTPAPTTTASAPTAAPTPAPVTPSPTHAPTPAPSHAPTAEPTAAPTPTPATPSPTHAPTPAPSHAPTAEPTAAPTPTPATPSPTHTPTPAPSHAPTAEPTAAPTPTPATPSPTHAPTPSPPQATTTPGPTVAPTASPPQSSPPAVWHAHCVISGNSSLANADADAIVHGFWGLIGGFYQGNVDANITGTNGGGSQVASAGPANVRSLLRGARADCKASGYAFLTVDFSGGVPIDPQQLEDEVYGAGFGALFAFGDFCGVVSYRLDQPSQPSVGDGKPLPCDSTLSNEDPAAVAYYRLAAPAGTTEVTACPAPAGAGSQASVDVYSDGSLSSSSLLAQASGDANANNGCATASFGLQSAAEVYVKVRGGTYGGNVDLSSSCPTDDSVYTDPAPSPTH